MGAVPIRVDIMGGGGPGLGTAAVPAGIAVPAAPAISMGEGLIRADITALIDTDGRHGPEILA
jgi:hypothetical protein